MSKNLDYQSIDSVESTVMDSTFSHAVAPDSLAASYTYDANGNLATETRGPDQRGWYFMKTYTFVTGKLMAESAWVKQ